MKTINRLLDFFIIVSAIVMLVLFFSTFVFGEKTGRDITHVNSRYTSKNFIQEEPVPVVCSVQVKKEPQIAKDDIDLLARLIFCEMGSDWHPDEQLYNVGSVVINRVLDERFPSTLQNVIYQPGQYAPAIYGQLDTVTPTERCYKIAEDLLTNGSRLPADVVFQAEFRQGTKTVETYYDKIGGTTTYYCK